MGRWEPDAQGRLQLAALTLFAERGYADVTVAEIADRAGLTKRTFFNHFADKREVLFAGAKEFEAGVVEQVAAADPALAPLDAAVVGLTWGGQELAQYRDYARGRQQLIASSTELQERDLIKSAMLAAAVARALRARSVPARIASLTAQAAVAVFSTAYADSIDGSVDSPSADSPSADVLSADMLSADMLSADGSGADVQGADVQGADFPTLMQRTLADLRTAIGCWPASAEPAGSPAGSAVGGTGLGS